jgi:hypothetical protein
MRTILPNSPSPPRGAERVGVRWGYRKPELRQDPPHPPHRFTTGPLPLPPQAGGEGKTSRS